MRLMGFYFFSTSVELQSDNVCVSVSREAKNGSINLKFGTLVDWMNTWWTFFHFFKIFNFEFKGQSRFFMACN